LGGLIGKVLSDSELDKVARETGFIKRKRKISAISILESFVFSGTDGYASLSQIAQDHLLQYKTPVTKQGIDKRFTTEARFFLETILSRLIRQQINIKGWDIKAYGLKKLNVKDSTKFNIPDHMKESYPGTGGAGSKATASLQVEIDLLNGQLGGISLTPALYSDQTESKRDLHHIESDCLYIRDLGYVSHHYMQKLKEANSYFINRLPTRSEVFIKKENSFIKINMKELYKKLRKQSNTVDMEVYIGEEKIQARLIAHLVPDEVRRERIKKKESFNKKYNYQSSEDFKNRVGMNLMVTNFTKDKIQTAKVLELYHLRWQIELLFKAWKSILKINRIRNYKGERVLCQLYGKLILAVLSWGIYSGIKSQINASIIKIYNHMLNAALLIRNYLLRGKEIWLTMIRDIPIDLIRAKQKRGKIKTSQII
jgi:hypothetical protein